MNAQGKLIEALLFPDWIIWVSFCAARDYRCWVRTPEGIVLNDGERYASEDAAMKAGRIFVYSSLETDVGGQD